MTDKTARNRGLGRGLSALMSDVETQREAAPVAPDLHLPIEQVRPNPGQPRRTFDETALEELAASIREKGVIQPIIVRRDPGRPDSYQIVAGERRWRASQIAQQHRIPALLREYDDDEVLEIAIIENIQRSDLNPIDEAQGYQSLMDRHGQTQEQLAATLGKSRSHIANQVRLLNLPAEVIEMLTRGRLTAGQARPLIGHEKAAELARKVVAQGLSARAVEKLARTPDRPRRNVARPHKDADTRQIEADLAAQLKMSVSIDTHASGEGGKLVLHYRNLDQLDDLLRILSGG